MARISQIVLIAILIWGTPTLANAQVFEQFKKTVLTANQHFGEHDYKNARHHYQSAYELRPEPLLLYNIAQCLRMEGSAEPAIAMYRQYLEAPVPNPQPPAVANARQSAVRHIKTLEASMQAAAKLAANKSPPKPVDPPSKLPRVARGVVVDAPMGVASGTREEHSIPSSTWVSWGVGGTALATAGVFAVLGRRAETDHKRDQTQASADRVDRWQNATNGSLVIAGAATVTGVVLYVWSRSRRRSRPNIPTITVGADRRGAAVNMGMSF